MKLYDAHELTTLSTQPLLKSASDLSSPETVEQELPERLFPRVAAATAGALPCEVTFDGRRCTQPQTDMTVCSSCFHMATRALKLQTRRARDRMGIYFMWAGQRVDFPVMAWRRIQNEFTKAQRVVTISSDMAQFENLMP